MLLSEEVATATSTSHFSGFDVFVILFTILIFIGVIRSVSAPQKNKFAIAFGVVSLIVFLILDVVMVMNWFGMFDLAG